jgi:RimJ/RimL family protein N-acetyltransferase
MTITTPRLLLVPASAASLRAELDGPDHLAAVLGTEVPADWPPDLYDRDAVLHTLARLEADPDQAGWWLHYFVRKPAAGPTGLEPPPPIEGLLVGCGGYKGPPTGDRVVEIGYSVVRGCRRRGYAAEAAAGLVRHAFGHAGVEKVVADTLPELVGSIGVLERCGFLYEGRGSDAGAVRYALGRQDWIDGFTGARIPLDAGAGARAGG